MNALVSAFGISVEQVARAREQATANRVPLMDALQDQLGCTPLELGRRLTAVFHYKNIPWQELVAASPAFDVLTFSECMRRDCAAVRAADGGLLVVLANPYDPCLLDWIEAHVESDFEYRLAHRLEINDYLARQEEPMRAMDAASVEAPKSTVAQQQIEDLSLQHITESDSPVVRLVNSTLYDALKSRASDIHFEATGNGITIKYRVDGVLGIVKSLDGVALGEQVISRIKVIAELDIAERRIPQDGRFHALSRSQEVDFRVSIMPSIYGEDAVLRILDKRYLVDQREGLRLDHLGFPAEIMRQLRWLAAEPHGMLLVTGPTGSGKTTTLYAVISEVNKGAEKIVTIEDPVEYQLPGVLQIPVNEKKGMTFARGLRSILRHDPDRIMVGEMRDAETAEIAIQAALTGHLVYTTVHANNVSDVIGRLLHMMVDPYSFVAAINAVMAQRLIRTNCPHCAAEYSPDDELVATSRLPRDITHEYQFKHGIGCAECRGSGYRGRRAIGELLVFNDDLRELVVSRAPARMLKERAVANGTRFLRDAALDLVRSGATTLEEANRVTSVA